MGSAQIPNRALLRSQSFSARAGSQDKHFSEAAISTLLDGLDLKSPSEERKSTLTKELGEKNLQEFLSLSQEPDPVALSQGLLRLAGRLAEQDKLDWALKVYGALQQMPASVGTESVAKQAEQRMQAILGQGSSGLRAEFLISKFAKDSTDLKMIVPMLAGTAVSSLVKTAALGRFAAMSGEAWYAGGFEAKLAANLFAYGVEVPTFALTGRALRNMGAKPNAQEPSLGQELESSAITLGMLKLFSFAGNQAYGKLHGVNELGAATRFAGLAKFNQAAIGQASMFLGMLSAHKTEERLELRPHVDGATTITDTLASMVSMGVGAHLGNKALGEGYAQWHQEMNVRTQAAEQVLEKPRRLPSILRNPLLAPMWMAMGVGGAGGSPFGYDSMESRQASGSSPASRSLALKRQAEYAGASFEFEFDIREGRTPSENTLQSLQDGLLDILATGEEEGEPLQGSLAERLRREAKLKNDLVGLEKQVRVRWDVEGRKLLSLQVFRGNTLLLDLNEDSASLPAPEKSEIRQALPQPPLVPAELRKETAALGEKKVEAPVAVLDDLPHEAELEGASSQIRNYAKSRGYVAAIQMQLRHLSKQGGAWPSIAEAGAVLFKATRLAKLPSDAREALSELFFILEKQVQGFEPEDCAPLLDAFARALRDGSSMAQVRELRRNAIPEKARLEAEQKANALKFEPRDPKKISPPPPSPKPDDHRDILNALEFFSQRQPSWRQVFLRARRLSERVQADPESQETGGISPRDNLSDVLHRVLEMAKDEPAMTPPKTERWLDFFEEAIDGKRNWEDFDSIDPLQLRRSSDPASLPRISPPPPAPEIEIATEPEPISSPVSSAPPSSPRFDPAHNALRALEFFAQGKVEWQRVLAAATGLFGRIQTETRQAPATESELRISFHDTLRTMLDLAEGESPLSPAKAFRWLKALQAALDGKSTLEEFDRIDPAQLGRTPRPEASEEKAPETPPPPVAPEAAPEIPAPKETSPRAKSVPPPGNAPDNKNSVELAPPTLDASSRKEFSAIIPPVAVEPAYVERVVMPSSAERSGLMGLGEAFRLFAVPRPRQEGERQVTAHLILPNLDRILMPLQLEADGEVKVIAQGAAQWIDMRKWVTRSARVEKVNGYRGRLRLTFPDGPPVFEFDVLAVQDRSGVHARLELSPNQPEFLGDRNSYFATYPPPKRTVDALHIEMIAFATHRGHGFTNQRYSIHLSNGDRVETVILTNHHSKGKYEVKEAWLHRLGASPAEVKALEVYDGAEGKGGKNHIAFRDPSSSLNLELDCEMPHSDVKGGVIFHQAQVKKAPPAVYLRLGGIPSAPEESGLVNELETPSAPVEAVGQELATKSVPDFRPVETTVRALAAEVLGGDLFALEALGEKGRLYSSAVTELMEIYRLASESAASAEDFGGVEPARIKAGIAVALGSAARENPDAISQLRILDQDGMPEVVSLIATVAAEEGINSEEAISMLGAKAEGGDVKALEFLLRMSKQQSSALSRYEIGEFLRNGLKDLHAFAGKSFGDPNHLPVLENLVELAEWNGRAEKHLKESVEAWKLPLKDTPANALLEAVFGDSRAAPLLLRRLEYLASVQQATLGQLFRMKRFGSEPVRAAVAKLLGELSPLSRADYIRDRGVLQTLAKEYRNPHASKLLVELEARPEKEKAPKTLAPQSSKKTTPVIPRPLDENARAREKVQMTLSAALKAGHRKVSKRIFYRSFLIAIQGLNQPSLRELRDSSVSRMLEYHSSANFKKFWVYLDLLHALSHHLDREGHEELVTMLQPHRSRFIMDSASWADFRCMMDFVPDSKEAHAREVAPIQSAKSGESLTPSMDIVEGIQELILRTPEAQQDKYYLRLDEAVNELTPEEAVRLAEEAIAQMKKAAEVVRKLALENKSIQEPVVKLAMYYNSFRRFLDRMDPRQRADYETKLQIETAETGVTFIYR